MQPSTHRVPQVWILRPGLRPRLILSDTTHQYVVAFNGSFFNTNRTVKQSVRNAYYPVTLLESAPVEEPAPVGR